jgi:hypothetical protein
METTANDGRGWTLQRIQSLLFYGGTTNVPPGISIARWKAMLTAASTAKGKVADE